MLTLFASPKSFHGHFKIIQENAIRSWTLLRPACEIILFGNEEGVAEIAAKYGLCHVSQITCNEYGTPLLNSLFEQAENLATFDVLCYINADIILLDDFIRAVEQVVNHQKRFLMAGQRWNLDVKESLDFETNWQEILQTQITQNGQIDHAGSIDYFVFSRGLWGEIPPFAIGRYFWDNWLLYRARLLKMPVIDASQIIKVVHQNHNYSHVKIGAEDLWNSPEVKHNYELIGNSWHYAFTLRDATYMLTRAGLKRAYDRSHIQRWLITLPLFYPKLYLKLKPILKISYTMRDRLGFTLQSTRGSW